MDGAVLPLLSRVFKITIVILAIAAILSNWGYNTTTILAGLGIGGVAIALAAQKTIENLFGGVAVISDHPVSVGDFCRFGDRVGTIEDIGLRSTRIRTPDRTLLNVPNAQFSSMTLENFSRRDKTLFHLTLNLRRDTTPDQSPDTAGIHFQYSARASENRDWEPAGAFCWSGNILAGSGSFCIHFDSVG
jgi:MscS family membrane protein